MKKGYLYLVVDDKCENGRPYHFHDIGELVVCTGQTTYDDGVISYICKDQSDTEQWMYPEHVVEIGESGLEEEEDD